MKEPPRRLRRLFIPSSKNYRNKFTIFVVCVIISFFMWGLIKLSKVYEAPLIFRITYSNMPADKVLVKAQDTLLTLYVRARGLELYAKMFARSKNTINVDLSGMRLRREGNSYYGFVRTSRFLNELSEQLPQENSLIGVQPDTLRFVFEQELRKRVPVHPHLQLTFEPQYQLYDSLKLSPDSVTVFGTKSILDTLYHVNTEQLAVKGLKQSKLLNLRLERPNVTPPVTLSTDTVTAEITVDRFTEAEVEVPIRDTTNRSIRYRTYPDKVTLTCRVAMQEYGRLDPSLFAVTIDVNEAVTSGNTLAEVRVIRQPVFAKVIRIEPARVEFLILK